MIQWWQICTVWRPSPVGNEFVSCLVKVGICKYSKHVCMYIYICMYVYTHISTHTHTCIHHTSSFLELDANFLFLRVPNWKLWGTQLDAWGPQNTLRILEDVNGFHHRIVLPGDADQNDRPTSLPNKNKGVRFGWADIGLTRDTYLHECRS